MNLAMFLFAVEHVSRICRCVQLLWWRWCTCHDL